LNPVLKRIDWPECAARLARALPRERLHSATLAWANQSPPNEPWAVAFSGGADSLALILLLWIHWPERRKKLCALHFNHRLRGAAADRDQQFSKDVCMALRIQWRSGGWREAHRHASEAEARKARHAFFAAQMSRRRTRALWLGHQQDDIAETLFMRIARGSGTGGLSAPRPVQAMMDHRVHLRPLLTLKKAELVESLRAAGARWREDGSNSGDNFLRNRIRRKVLPAWRAANADRDALAGAALSRELIEEDDAALEAWLAAIDPIAKNGALNLRRLAGKPRALVRRALRRWLASNGKGEGISRQAFAALLEDVMARRVTQHSIGTNELAVIGAQRLTLRRAAGKQSSRFHHPAN